MKKLAICIVILFLNLIVCAKHNVALAQDDAKGFSITPFFKEITLTENSQAEEFELEVVNNRDFPMVFRISALDFGALNETSGVAFVGSQDLKNKYNLASWISLDRDAIVLVPGEKQIVRGSVENKDSLSPGGHYSAIVFRMEDDNSSLASVDLNPSIASLIFVRKLGGEIYGLELKEKEIIRGIFGLPLIIRLRFQNTGNVHLSPRGLVKVLDPFGKEVSRGIINEESGLILPETFRIFPTTLRNIATAFMPGMYNISIDYRYDGKDDFISQQQKMFLIPVAFIIFCLAIIIIMVGYFWFKYKQKNK